MTNTDSARRGSDLAQRWAAELGAIDDIGSPHLDSIIGICVAIGGHVADLVKYVEPRNYPAEHGVFTILSGYTSQANVKLASVR